MNYGVMELMNKWFMQFQISNFKSQILNIKSSILPIK